MVNHIPSIEKYNNVVFYLQLKCITFGTSYIMGQRSISLRNLLDLSSMLQKCSASSNFWQLIPYIVLKEIFMCILHILISLNIII
jgi:hypothetical protein